MHRAGHGTNAPLQLMLALLGMDEAKQVQLGTVTMLRRLCWVHSRVVLVHNLGTVISEVGRVLWSRTMLMSVALL